MLRFGPDTGPVVIAALPLFEEANRTRTFVVTILRALAARGIASLLPDLPGTGESLLPTESAAMLDLESAYAHVAAFAARANRHVYGLAVRSGTLLDDLAVLRGRWHLSPQDGKSLLRELTRVKQAEVGPTQSLPDYWFLGGDTAATRPVEIAGNRISAELLAVLKLRTPFADPAIARRVVRVTTDPNPADRKFDSAPLWRRSEPDNNIPLSEHLADDIAEWIAACER